MDTGSVKYFILLAVVALTAACSSSNGTTSKSLDIKFLPTHASWYDVYPGVESSLRFTRNYKASLSGYANDSIVAVNILVDSVRVPISGLSINGERLKGELVLFGEYESVEFYAGRSFYTTSNRGPQTTPVVFEANDSPLPDGHIAIEFSGDGRLFSIPLGEATVLDPMFAP